MSPSRPGVLLVLHLALGLANALQDDLLRSLRGDAPEVGGRVVPLAGDVALFVELLRDHADLAGLDVDLDERLLGRFRHPLVRGDERVRERLEHDLFGNALFDRERGERLEHLGILHDFPFARARAWSFECLAPASRTRLRAPFEHGARLSDVGDRDLLVDAVVGFDDATRAVETAKHAAHTSRTRASVELDRHLLAESAEL